MLKKYSLSLLVFLCAITFGFGQTPWINEIHYDNSGGDVNEGVEVAVPLGYSCSNLRLRLNNGATGGNYQNVQVNTTNGTTTNGITFFWTDIPNTQNGSPDGIALVCADTGTLIQFLSYEGTFIANSGPETGLSSVDIGVFENNSTTATQSLQLQGTGCQYSDFTWVANVSNTQNNINTGQTINCGSPTCNISNITLTNTSTCNDNGTPSDSNDDYYTTDVTIDYSNDPGSGNITLTSTGIGGTTSIAVDSSGSQTIIGVQLPANGNTVDLTATFSDETTCNYTETIASVPSCSSSGSSTCADESFVNAGNTGSYGVINWTGDDTIDWSATDARSDQDLAGDEAIMLRTGSLTNDNSFPNGMSIISFDYARIFSGNSTLQVFVNGTQFGGDINVSLTTPTNFSFAVNIAGAIDLELRNSGNRTLISNLTWDCFACTGTPDEITGLTAVEGCGSIDLSWIAPSCADEVLIVARETNPVAAGTPTGDGSSYTADSDFSGAGSNLLLGKVVYKGSANSVSVTGLINGSDYHFAVFSVITATSTWSSRVIEDLTYNGTIENPTLFTSYNSCGDISLQWTNPVCFDEVMVVAKASGTVTATPTLGSGAYTANSTFGTGGSGANLPANEYAVYKGTGETVTITGLTDGPYEFKIFTRLGSSSWSTGVVTSAVSSSGSSSGPTTFNPGDLVFVGYDSFIGGATDKYSILNLVDIGVGTDFIIANLLYEWNAPASVSTNRWYLCATVFDEDPPYAEITYNGCADIPKGSVICITTSGGTGPITSITINGVDAFADFDIDPVNNSAGNISTSNPDAMWLMQGSFSAVVDNGSDGIDPDGPSGSTVPGTGNPDKYRTFTGSVLGALQTKGDFQPFSDTGNAGGARISRIHPDVECVFLQTGTTSSTKFFGYHNGITSGSQYQLLTDIIDQSNWVFQSGTGGVQDSDNINSVCNSSFTVTGGATASGKWLGGISEDWFDCRNWENFAVPNAFVDVTIDGTAANNSRIDYDSPNALKFGFQGDCNNLMISGSSLLIEDADDVLLVSGDLTINGSGSLDMNGASTTEDGKLLISGNWINAIGEAAFDEGNSTVTFNGSGPQTITYPGNPPVPTPLDTEIFYNIVLQNAFDIDIASGDRTLHANGDLTINSNPAHTLIVRSGSYVYVGNSVINNNTTAGSFTLEDSASLIQNNPVNSNSGNLTMLRNYSVDSSYDYIYWSSPIANFNTSSLPINNNHVYTWDPTAPNTGTGNQQGNWVPAVGQNMQLGMGYIARVPAATNSTLTFQNTNGVPHSGTVNLSLSRGNDNDGMNGDDDDDDWNLVGNPYPSSISAFTFLDDNPTIDGFINIWTHGEIPDDMISDPFYENNNGYNYDPDDYITYNGTATTNGPTGFNGYIASGQSFMVNTVNGGSSNSIPLSFTNSMRRLDYNNSNFYRLSNSQSNRNATNEMGVEKHRIWLDLASENNGVDRIVLGYVSDATMERDRLYDAITYNKEGLQNFYSLIQDEIFIIQGRSLPFTDTDIIPLGFNSVSEDNYTIAINAVDGIFENDQIIFLRDNYLNLIHNLSENPYTFNSEIGQFDDRFEIVFQEDALSINENELDDSGLTIFELPNGSVQFNVPNNFSIEQVEIIDLLGRTIYHLKGNSYSMTYRLDLLSKAAYVAKVTLSSGQVLTKKAIKQK